MAKLVPFEPLDAAVVVDVIEVVEVVELVDDDVDVSKVNVDERAVGGTVTRSKS